MTIDVSGVFISKPEPIEDYVLTDYTKIDFCSWGYHHTNGTDETNGSITAFCKGSDLIKNMIDTKLGKVCYRCYDVIPEEFLKDLTKKQRRKK